ncbi:MAG: ribosome silencing factor [Myxococcaceae bacterium]
MTNGTKKKKAPATRTRAPAKGAAKGAAKKKPAAKKRPTRASTAAAPKQRATRKPKVTEAANKLPPAENPTAKALARKIADLVIEKKASDVNILDVRGIASYADYVVLASGESDRQVTAMAENVLSKLKQEGEQAVGSEGFETGQWVLLDYGDVVAHLFFQDVRSHYDLEGLWADAPKETVA